MTYARPTIGELVQFRERYLPIPSRRASTRAAEGETMNAPFHKATAEEIVLRANRLRTTPAPSRMKHSPQVTAKQIIARLHARVNPLELRLWLR